MDSLLSEPPSNLIMVALFVVQLLRCIRFSATPWTVCSPDKNPGVGCHFLLYDGIIVFFIFLMLGVY